jgi:hypothetical protein
MIHLKPVPVRQDVSQTIKRAFQVLFLTVLIYMLMCLPLIRLIFQKHRYRDSGENRPIRINAEADGALLEKVATPNEKGRLLLLAASDRMRLSARGYHRVFRVARTLADLEGAESIARIHIAEALAFRRIAPDKSLIKARA